MKYNFKEYKFSSHYFILNLIEKNKKVLDIGCASGYLALSLKEKSCLVDGIDIDINIVEKAKKYCNAYVLDISKDKIDHKYDVIILGDVLEHLIDPWGVLFSLKNNTEYSFLEIKYTPIPFYLRFPFLPKKILKVLNLILYFLAKIWPSLFAYQFIAKIKNA